MPDALRIDTPDLLFVRDPDRPPLTPAGRRLWRVLATAGPDDHVTHDALAVAASIPTDRLTRTMAELVTGGYVVGVPHGDAGSVRAVLCFPIGAI